jgi:hypothetical protein
MKNINTFMSDSNVVELSSTEMNEIAGGLFGSIVRWFVGAIKSVLNPEMPTEDEMAL